MHPPSLRHGIDIVENERIDLLLQRHGDRFLDRCYTERERQWAFDGLDAAEMARLAATPATALASEADAGAERRRQRNRRQCIERLSVRFAAKEAALKALGTGWRSGIAWTDVEVTRQPSGEPGIQLHGEAAAIADRQGLRTWTISLSHAGAYSIASVIALGG